MKYFQITNIFHSAAILNNLDKTSNSMPTSAFYKFLMKLNKTNIKLLDEDDFFFSNRASETQMLKIKLEM